MEIVICKKVRYPVKPSGQVDTSYPAKLIRSEMKITREFVDNWNKNNAKLTGVKYIIDEEATEDYYKKCKKVNAERKKQKDIEKSIAASKIGELAQRTANELVKNNNLDSGVGDLEPQTQTDPGPGPEPQTDTPDLNKETKKPGRPKINVSVTSAKNNAVDGK